MRKTKNKVLKKIKNLKTMKLGMLKRHTIFLMMLILESIFKDNNNSIEQAIRKNWLMEVKSMKNNSNSWIQKIWKGRKKKNNKPWKRNTVNNYSKKKTSGIKNFLKNRPNPKTRLRRIRNRANMLRNRAKMLTTFFSQTKKTMKT